MLGANYWPQKSFLGYSSPFVSAFVACARHVVSDPHVSQTDSCLLSELLSPHPVCDSWHHTCHRLKAGWCDNYCHHTPCVTHGNTRPVVVCRRLMSFVCHSPSSVICKNIHATTYSCNSITKITWSLGACSKT